MALIRPTVTHSAATGSSGVAGMTVILLGLVCLVVGLVVDGGFFRGLFIGATSALMVLGAFLVGASTWHGPRSEQDLDDGGQWLPSRDDSSDRTDR